MKRIYTFLATLALTAFAFSAVLYTSCSKSKCSGVACYNSGYCSGGTCTCPVGYSGVHCEYSSITFQNNTFTPISISVNGASATIPVGSAVAFSGESNTAATVSATTAGSTSNGVQLGETISWNYTDQFPTGGNTLTDPLNVSADYFFLYISNWYTSPITSINVNYGLTVGNLTDFLTIPADRNTYATGYYFGYSNTAIYCNFADLSYYITGSSLSIPFVLNASYHVVVN